MHLIYYEVYRNNQQIGTWSRRHRLTWASWQTGLILHCITVMRQMDKYCTIPAWEWAKRGEWLVEIANQLGNSMQSIWWKEERGVEHWYTTDIALNYVGWSVKCGPGKQKDKDKWDLYSYSAFSMQLQEILHTILSPLSSRNPRWSSDSSNSSNLVKYIQYLQYDPHYTDETNCK